MLSAKSALGESDATYDWLDYEHKQKQALEDTRLLYVAATRAVKRLYLLFRTQNEQEFKSPPALSLLRRIWAAVEHDVVWIDTAVTTEIAPAIIRAELQRVPLAWAGSTPLSPPLEIVANPPEPIADSFEIRLGNTLHQTLEGIARTGAANWTRLPPQRQLAVVTQLLRQQGLADAEIEAAALTIAAAAAGMLADERGAWLLDAAHTEAVSEWELLTAGGKRFVIDRSFVDGDGVRWIVDYKSALPQSGETPDAFARREAEMYRPQLQNYRDVIRTFETRPLRMALYFPRLTYWIEIEEQ